MINNLAFPQDKANHLIYGLLVFIIFGLLDPKLGLAVATVAAIVKELYDYYSKKSTPEIKDALYTIFGALLGYFCTTL